MEIVEGVHLVDGVRSSNCYLLAGRALALVDTGWPGHAGAVLRYIRRLGREPQDLRYILFTHGHPDHTGSAMTLRRLTGARALAHAADTRHSPRHGLWASYVSQPFAFRRSVPLFCQVPVDAALADGDCLDVLDGLRVYHTPGHTPGSVCLHLERRGVLFTGDTVLTYSSGCSRSMGFPGYDATSYRRSLRRIAALDFDVACGGHGSPLVGKASEALKLALETGRMESYFRVLRARLARALPNRHERAVDR